MSYENDIYPLLMMVSLSAIVFSSLAVITIVMNWKEIRDESRIYDTAIPMSGKTSLTISITTLLVFLGVMIYLLSNLPPSF